MKITISNMSFWGIFEKRNECCEGWLSFGLGRLHFDFNRFYHTEDDNRYMYI